MLLSPTLMSITHYSTYLFTAAPIIALYVHILHRYGRASDRRLLIISTNSWLPKAAASGDRRDLPQIGRRCSETCFTPHLRGERHIEIKRPVMGRGAAQSTISWQLPRGREHKICELAPTGMTLRAIPQSKNIRSSRSDCH